MTTFISLLMFIPMVIIMWAAAVMLTVMASDIWVEWKRSRK